MVAHFHGQVLTGAGGAHRLSACAVYTTKANGTVHVPSVLPPFLTRLIRALVTIFTGCRERGRVTRNMNAQQHRPTSILLRARMIVAVVAFSSVRGLVRRTLPRSIYMHTHPSPLSLVCVCVFVCVCVCFAHCIASWGLISSLWQPRSNAELTADVSFACCYRGVRRRLQNTCVAT